MAVVPVKALAALIKQHGTKKALEIARKDADSVISHFDRLLEKSKSKALAQLMSEDPEAVTLYRNVRDPYALEPRMPQGAVTDDELHGRYWGFSPKESTALKMGDPGPLDTNIFKDEMKGNASLHKQYGEDRTPRIHRSYTRIVKGKPVKGSKTIVIDNQEELANVQNVARNRGYIQHPEDSGVGVTRLLRDLGYDFAATPDFETSLGKELYQVIQLKPQKVRAKLGKKEALLGLGATGGSMGILDLLEPSEAEAMPRGVYQAIGKAVVSKEVSSAAKVLVGKVLDGKTIKDVRKGQGNWRAILFDDETMMTVTNTELNDLSRAFGSQKYTKEFLQKEGPSRTEQAIKSLDYHYARVKPLSTQTLIEQHHHMHRERLKEMGGSSPDFSLVLYKGKYFTMPKVYAEHLQELGMLQIKKDAK